MLLLDYINFLNKEADGIENLIKKIIQDNSGKILSIIKLRLYQKGIDGDGNAITPEYALGTIVNKKGKNQITSHVTLRDSGSWYKSLYVYYEDGYILTNSNQVKTIELVEKYGNSILEFTNDEIKLIIDSIIEPEILKRINSVKQIELDF